MLLGELFLGEIWHPYSFIKIGFGPSDWKNTFMRKRRLLDPRVTVWCEHLPIGPNIGYYHWIFSSCATRFQLLSLILKNKTFLFMVRTCSDISIWLSWLLSWWIINIIIKVHPPNLYRYETPAHYCLHTGVFLPIHWCKHVQILDKSKCSVHLCVLFSLSVESRWLQKYNTKTNF